MASPSTHSLDNQFHGILLLLEHSANNSNLPSKEIKNRCLSCQHSHHKIILTINRKQNTIVVSIFFSFIIVTDELERFPSWASLWLLQDSSDGLLLVPTLSFHLQSFQDTGIAFLRKPHMMAQMIKNLPAVQETWVRSLGWEDPLEKEKATHFSILTWEMPWTAEECGGLQSMGSQRVGHHWVADTCIYTHMHSTTSNPGKSALPTS